MAELSDRPDAVTGGAEPYRSLSVPAVLGCALAALYAAFLALCAVASFATGMPLYLPYSSLVVPGAAFILSALGWLQVQRSEGTRAGGRLAVWGMALGGLFGLGYWAYLEGSRVAVNAQAEAFTDGWIELIRKGQLEEAFRLTIPPEQRPQEGPELRRNLELRFNNPDPSSSRPGPYTAFQDCDIVLLLNHGRDEKSGADTVVRPLGLKEWDYRGGSYHALLEYDVHTPERAFQLQVALQGTESPQEGRQWAVLVPESHPKPPFDEQPLSQRVMSVNMASVGFMNEWLEKLAKGKQVEAYLETLEPGRRRELQALGAARLVGEGLIPGVGPAVGAGTGAQTFLPGYREFRAGNILRADEKTFWAEGPLRTTVPADVRRMFSHVPQAFAGSLRPNSANMAAWERDGKKLRYYHDFQMGVPPRYLVQGTFVTETDASVLDEAEPSPVWRVVAIDLTAGRILGAGRNNPVMRPRP